MEENENLQTQHEENLEEKTLNEEAENQGATSLEENLDAQEKTPQDVKNEKNEKTKKDKQKKDKTQKVKTSKNDDLDLNNLTDEELYAHLQTEKLLKKKRNKKIATIASLCVAFALAFVVIILSAVPVSLKPNFLQKGSVYDVKFYRNNETNPCATLSAEENEEKFEQFLKLYDQAFSQTYMAALFSGSLNNYEVSDRSKQLASADAIEELKKESSIGAGNNLVLIRFADEQIVTNKDGSIFESPSIPRSQADKALRFREAYFVINQNAGIQETKIFLIAKYPVTKSDQKANFYILTLTIKADTNKIFSKWADLTKAS